MTASLVNSHSLIGHYVILWLDSDINHANECIKTSFNSIEHRIDSIKVLVNIDQFIGFIQNLQKQQIFVIITDSCDQQNIRFINHIEETNQIHSVYLYSNHLSKGKFWQYSSKKFKGIFSQIEQICDLLEQITCPLETHSLSTTIISAVATNPDEYNLSYIYLKLFLEIIYKIEYDDKTRKDAFDYYRRWCVDNRINEDKVDQFEQYYNTDDYPPVWWYSKDIPLYGLLRDALLTLNVDVLIKLGCFLQDLHRSIRKIYLQNNQTENFIVYRGQGMLDEDFEKLRQRKNDLFVFHNFISTTTNEQTGLHFAKNASVNSETKGILFQMNIDPLVGSVLYASLDTVSFYSNAENEILFSTLTVFKIEEINQINDGLWKVNLTLTSQINEIFKFYIDQIRSEIQGKTPWHSLALLFYKMGKYNQAREIFKRIIETTDETSSENL